MLMAGNPTRTSGFGYNAFYKNKHLWRRFTLSSRESALVSKQFIEEMVQEYGEDSDIFKVRVLGEFPSASVNQLISRELAETAAKRKLNKSDYYFAPVILTCDPAWEGNDRNCIAIRQGLFSAILFSKRNIKDPAVTLGGLLNQYWTEYGADACFIDIGWGSGVVDYLRSIGRNPVAVNFGGSSLNPEYANKRTETGVS